MPRKKIAAIESPSNSMKNISLTLQNEENKEKSNCTVKKKKRSIPRSRKNETTGSSTIVTPLQPVGEAESPTASLSKKPRRKIRRTKSPRNSKTKKLLTETNMNVNNAKSRTVVKKRKIYARRSSGRKEITHSPSVVDPFQFIASPASSCSKKPLKKVITTKSPRNPKKKKLMAECTVNENNKKSDCTLKQVKNGVMCLKSGIIEGADPSLALSSLEYFFEKTASPTATSSSKKPQRKILKTKSPRTSKKRKLPPKQKDHENNEENNRDIRKKELCNLKPGDRKDDAPFNENISSAKAVAVLKEIAMTAASFVQQENHKNYEENDSNEKMKHDDLQSVEREDSVGYSLSAANVTLIRDTGSIVTSSMNSKCDYKNFQETKCLICLELEESSMLFTMPCGHCFHSLCMQTWFQVKKSCPVCNPENSAVDDASNNCGIGDVDESSDMIELHHIDRAVNELKKLNEDINEFLIRCVICMGASRSLQIDNPHDQFSDFKTLPCGHNVHTACALTSIVQETCPVCMEDSRIEDNIYEFPEEMRCVICLDTVESSNFEYISCCHSFHHQCIQTWFTVRRGEICPVCMVSSNSNAVEDEAIYGFLENVKCTICMDIEEFSEFQRLSCRHSFHTLCAQTWFQENNYCPTCMRNVSLDSNESDEEVRCAICVDTEESSVFEFLSCCHSFHAACIQSWLKKGKSCPICNTRILDMSNTVENVGCAAACN